MAQTAPCFGSLKFAPRPGCGILPTSISFVELARLGVDDGDLVRLVGSDQEVALGRVPAAVVQESRRPDRRDLQVVQVGIVDHQYLAGLLDVDHELGLEVAGNDRRDSRFGVKFLGVNGHAAGGDDLQRLERVAFHDDVLRRPVGAGDRVLVLEALVFRGVDRARFQPDLDLGDVVRLVHPQVDHVDLGVAPDDVDVAAGGRQARDVHRVAGLDDVDDLLGVAVDQRHLARVAQGHREQVLEVDLVHLLLRALLGRHDHLPGRLHLLHAELGRHRRLVLQKARHDVDVLVRQFAGAAPVRHAGRRAVVDEHLEVVGAARLGDVRGERLAGGALPQHAVAAGAALEVDLLGARELLRGHRRGLRADHVGRFARLDRHRGALVHHLSLGVPGCTGLSLDCA